MQRIKKVLDLPIQKGIINWPKLEEKIHAALSLVKGDFNSYKPDGEKIELKLSDALDFDVNTPKGIFIYKIFKPKFIDGDLYCSGYQLGFYKENGQPWFNPHSLVLF